MPTEETQLSQPRIDSQLCFALYSASNTIDQHYRPLLEAHGLTYAQYIVLMSLAEKDGVSITNLASRLNLSKATMTPLLRRLEEKDLLKRVMVEGDERQKLVKITDAGRALFSESCHATEVVFENSNLTLEEAETLVALCKRVSGV